MRQLNKVLWALLAPGLIWAVVRLGGWLPGRTIQLIAFTPYVAAWSLIPLALAAAARRWRPAGVAALTAVALAAAVLPRALPGDRGPAQGAPLTVMTANVLFGGADAAAIVRLVRDHDVEVLALQEFSEEARVALAGAGLETLLPHAARSPPPSGPPARRSTRGSRSPSRDPGATRAASCRRTRRCSRRAARR